MYRIWHIQHKQWLNANWFIQVLLKINHIDGSSHHYHQVCHDVQANRAFLVFGTSKVPFNQQRSLMMTCFIKRPQWFWQRSCYVVILIYKQRMRSLKDQGRIGVKIQHLLSVADGFSGWNLEWLRKIGHFFVVTLATRHPDGKCQ